MYGQMAALEGDLPIAAASVAIAVDGARPAVESYGRGRVQPVSLQLCQESFAYHGDGNGEVQLFSNEHILIEPRRRRPRQRIRSCPLGHVGCDRRSRAPFGPVVRAAPGAYREGCCPSWKA